MRQHEVFYGWKKQSLMCLFSPREHDTTGWQWYYKQNYMLHKQGVVIMHDTSTELTALQIHLWCGHLYKDGKQTEYNSHVCRSRLKLNPSSDDLSTAQPWEPHILAPVSALSVGPSKDVITVEEQLRHKRGAGWDKVIQTSLCDTAEPWEVKVSQVRETTFHCQRSGAENMQIDVKIIPLPRPLPYPRSCDWEKYLMAGASCLLYNDILPKPKQPVR